MTPTPPRRNAPAAELAWLGVSLAQVAVEQLRGLGDDTLDTDAVDELLVLLRLSVPALERLLVPSDRLDALAPRLHQLAEGLLREQPR